MLLLIFYESIRLHSSSVQFTPNHAFNGGERGKGTSAMYQLHVCGSTAHLSKCSPKGLLLLDISQVAQALD